MSRDLAGCILDVRMSTADIRGARARAGGDAAAYQAEVTAKLSSHLADCREHAADQGWPILATYTDNAVSGVPEFRNKGQVLAGRNAAMADLRARTAGGQHVVLLSTEVSRLYRSVEESRELLAIAKSARGAGGGVIVASSDGESFDLSDPHGEDKFTGAVKAAQLEARVVSRRRLRKEQRRAEEGGYWGTEPYGYHKIYTEPDDTGKRYYIAPWLVPCEADCASPRHTAPGEADVIRDAARMLIDDPRHSMAAITRDWAARGITSRSGRKWTQGEITRLLQNPLYNGIRVHRAGHPIDGRADRRSRGADTPGAWEAILGDDLFMAAQGVLGDPSRRKHVAGDTTRRHLLAGLAVHDPAECTAGGAKLRVRPGSRGGPRQYHCPVPPDGCGHCRRSVEAADNWVIARILEWLRPEPDGLFAKCLRKAEEAREAASAGRQAEAVSLEQAQRADEQALRGYKTVIKTRTGASLVALLDEIDAITKRMEDRAVKLRRLAEGPSPAEKIGVEEYARISAVLLGDDPAKLPARHALVASYVDRVVFRAPGQGTRSVFDPDTIRVVPAGWWHGNPDDEALRPPAAPAAGKGRYSEHLAVTVLRHLREHPGSTPREIALAISRSHPVVCMCLKTLREKGEVTGDREPKRGSPVPVRYTAR